MIFLDPEHSELTAAWMSTTSNLLLGTFSFVSIIGNGFVFWAMFVDRRLRTNSNMFILSLATSDFLMGCISIPVYMVLHITQRNVLGDAMCCITAFLDNTLVIVSMWTLVLTSLDRFLLIVYQRIYHEVLTTRNTILMVIAVWLYAVLIAALPLLGWNYYRFTGNSCSIGDQGHPYFRTFFFLTFPLPLIITATCYISIAIKANKVHSKAQSHSKVRLSSSSTSQLRSKSRSVTTDRVTRVTMMVLVLVLAHIVLTLPAFTINLIATFHITHINEHFEGLANDIVILMFFANAAVNPILYGLFNTNFQAAFNYCPCKGTSKTSPRLSMTRSIRSPSPYSNRNITPSRSPITSRSSKIINISSHSPSVSRKTLDLAREMSNTSSAGNCTNKDECEVYVNRLINLPSVVITDDNN